MTEAATALTKDDIRELLKEHTERVIKPLIKDEVKRAIEESEVRIVNDITKVLYQFMEEVDRRFLAVETDVRFLKTEFAVLNRKLDARLT